MKFQTFSIRLFVLSTGVAITLWGLHAIESISPFAILSWSSLLFFIIFSIAIFLLAKRAAASSNKHLFSQVFLGATVVKLFVSLALVGIYFFIVQPNNKYFILPFFFVYFCYTVFEVYFLTKLGNT